MTTPNERHPFLNVAQTVIAGVLVAAIVGAVTVISGVNDKLSDLKVHNGTSDERMTNLSDLVKSMYRAEDARRDNAETTKQLDDLKRRMAVVEASINSRPPPPQPRELQQWRKN